jgi:hypothetical protein
VLIESGSFRFENKRRISKIPVAPHHSVRGYVNCNIDYWNDKKCEKSCRAEKNAHNATSSVVKGAVNQLLTIRNWVIGCYPQICETVSRKLQMIDLSEYSKPGRCGPATEGPLEGIGSNEVRARGRLPPFQKKLLFYATFLYITLCTRKGGISRSLSAQAGRSFFLFITR